MTFVKFEVPALVNDLFSALPRPVRLSDDLLVAFDICVKWCVTGDSFPPRFSLSVFPALSPPHRYILLKETVFFFFLMTL